MTWQGDVVSLVEAFRSGERSPLDEAEATLAAIRASDLNAFSFVDADGVLERAATADVSLPLGGVPIGVGRNAFVAEHPGDLEHPLEATHGQALQVQLGSDPEVQLQVQGVVVGGERSGKGTARYGMEHRRLHLQEATLLQPATGRRDDPAAGHEGLPGPVGDQIGRASCRERV